MKRKPMVALALLLTAPTAAQPAPGMMKAIPVAAPTQTSIPLLADQPDIDQWERYFGQTMVRNVTRPTIYPVLPNAKSANGKAIIVVPGGGYNFVSMESEGFRVAERLAEAGYTSPIWCTPPDGAAAIPPDERRAAYGYYSLKGDCRHRATKQTLSLEF